MKKILLLLVAFIFASGCGLADGIDPKPISNNNQPTPIVTTAKVLDLSRKGLAKIDLSVFDQTNLTELNVSYNNLTGALPSQIGKLKNLKILNASNNQMTGVPAEIGQLSNLEILDLSNNKLTGLPNELANLKKLKTLNLSGNKYSQQDLKIIRDSLPEAEYILK